MFRYLAPTAKDAQRLKEILRKEGCKQVRAVKTPQGYRIYADRSWRKKSK